METETMATESEERVERPAKPGPTRTCVGCGRHDDAESLVRVVLGPRVGQEASTVAVDVSGGSFGRGAYMHARKDCLAKAAKGGFAKAFKCRVDANATEIAGQIAAGVDRRIAGLLLGARRAGHVAIGADAAAAALGKAMSEEIDACLVVANDAASIVERGIMAEAIAEGRAVAWKTKVELGALFGRDEVAVCVVVQESVAAQVLSARRLADAVSNAVPGNKAAKAKNVVTGAGRPPSTESDSDESRSDESKMTAEMARTGDAWKSREVR